MRLLVIWRNLVFFHDFLDNIQNYRIFFDTQQAILRFHNMVGASRVKSGNDSSILIASKRKLCLVAVAPRVLHPQDRLHGDSFIHTFPGTFPRHVLCFHPRIGCLHPFGCISFRYILRHTHFIRPLRQPQILHPADPAQVIVDLALLKMKLCLITHHLKLAAAALSCDRAFRHHAVFGCFQHLHQTGKAVIFLHFHRPRPDPIPDHGIFYKPDIAVLLSDPGSIFAHIFDCQFKFIIFPDFHVFFTPHFLYFASR